MSDLVIRRAEEQDLPPVLDLVEQLLRELGEEGDELGELRTEAVLGQWKSLGERTVALLAETPAGEAVGVADRSAPRVATPRREDAERLRRFAGTYRANIFCHSCPDGGPNVQDFEVEASGDGTIVVWDQHWVPVEPLYFASLDGRRHIGFKESGDGRIVALTAGSWKVLERIR